MCNGTFYQFYFTTFPPKACFIAHKTVSVWQDLTIGVRFFDLDDCNKSYGPTHTDENMR